jgi:hypothetical protein
MSNSKPVLVIGGSGVVGSLMARTLRRLHPEVPIAIGGRDLGKAEAVAAELGNAVAITIDLDRPDLGLSEGGSYGAVAIFVKDETLNALRYALDKGIPHIGVSSGTFEIGPEVALFVHDPDRAPVVMASQWLAGAAVFPVLHFASAYERLETIRIGAVLDEQDMGGPAASADYDRITTVAPAALTIEDGSALWVTGDLYYELAFANADEVPFPSVADAFYLLLYPFVYAGLALLLRGRLQEIRRDLWVDGLIAGTTIAALGAALVFGAVVEGTGGDPWAFWTNLAYPSADLGLIGVVTAVLAMTGWKVDRAWAFILLGCFVFGVADTAYLYATATSTYAEGALLDAGWVAGIALIAVAAWQPRRPVAPVRPDGFWAFALPTLFGTAALGLLVYDHFRPINTAALVLSTCAIGSVIARMVLTFRRNAQLLEASRRVRDVQAGAAQHGRLQVEEGGLADPGRDLGAHAEELRGLVHDHHAAGLGGRGDQGLLIQRDQAAQVDDLERADALLLGGLGRVHGHFHHGAVGDQGQVAALAQHPGGADRLGLDREVDLLLGPVAPLGLEEDHRVVALDGPAQQRVGVGGRGRGDHLEAGGVAVDGLGALGVVLDGPDGPAVGDAADHRHGLGAGRAVPVLGQVADDLVEGRVAEAVELHLGHGPVAAQGQPDADPHDRRLGQRGVHHPLLAEVLEQAVGDAEDPAEGADVLAEQDHPVVGLHGVAQGRVERPGHRDLRHRCLPHASAWNWASNSCSWRHWASRVAGGSA